MPAITTKCCGIFNYRPLSTARAHGRENGESSGQKGMHDEVYTREYIPMAGAWAPEDICQSALAEPQRPQQSLLRRKVLMICVECVCVRACVCVCMFVCVCVCVHMHAHVHAQVCFV